MAISHVHLAPDKALAKASAACDPLPPTRSAHQPGPFRPSRRGLGAAERISGGGRTGDVDPLPAAAKPSTGSTVDLRDRFSPAHIQVPVGLGQGRFADASRTTSCSPPARASSAARRSAAGKTYTTTFTTPGHYELFCYLHPMTMHETVEVTG